MAFAAREGGARCQRFRAEALGAPDSRAPILFTRRPAAGGKSSGLDGLRMVGGLQGAGRAGWPRVARWNQGS